MEKEIKIKVGDKVLLKNERGIDWNGSGLMDKYIGEVVTVSDVFGIAGEFFNIEEDVDYDKFFRDKWVFGIDDIERIVTEFKLDDLQFADIVTTRNGERYVVANEGMFGEKDGYWLGSEYIPNFYKQDLKYDSNLEGNRIYDIVKVERSGQVIWERSEEEKEVKEMTIAEISEALGYEVKVVKETEK